MKYLRRCSLFVLSLVMFVGIFSTTAHAEQNTDFNISVGLKLHNSGINFLDSYFDYIGSDSWLIPTVPINYATYFDNILYLSKSDGTLIAKKGEKFNFHIDNIRLEFVGTGTSNWNTYWHDKANTICNVALVHSDGTYTYLYDIDWVSNSGNLTHSISFDYTAEKDIKSIVYTETIMLEALSGFETHNKHYDVTVKFGYDNQLVASVEIESKEVGLLGSIVEKIKVGFDSVVGNFERMFSYLTDLVNKIKDLPNNFRDMLFGLFVPDKENIQSIIEDFKLMIEEHFGLLYQVGDIIHSSWEEVKTAAQTDTISIPEATINFGNSSFTFGGYEVKIVPDGFSVLVNALKLIIGVLCTISFVNGIRNRYEEVMGVEK